MCTKPDIKKIRQALISVYDKEGIDEIAKELVNCGVKLISTGGTYNYIKDINLPVSKVEDLTGYPSIFGGRVKTLHPKIFGGILYRRDMAEDLSQAREYDIPDIDLVIVDLYPFEQYVKGGASHEEIIEKIDIGGISLIRAAAKNYKDVIIVPCKGGYAPLLNLLKARGGESTLEEREYFANYAFLTSSAYDTQIFKYFNRNNTIEAFNETLFEPKALRYGENPHQHASFFGESASIPQQLHGKEISYNNMLDIEAAIELISDFDTTTVAVIKHNNACGCASRETVLKAWKDALAADPVSAYGGIIISNTAIDAEAAREIGKIFFEVIIAPAYDDEALTILKEKKNRIILLNRHTTPSKRKVRSMFDGFLVQERDTAVEKADDLKVVTEVSPQESQIADLLFANKIVKHSKSNAIVLAKDGMLLASGIGQTSRVDALKQAIVKAGTFGFDLHGAVMASDAFFPFPDCVEIADKAGVTAIIHPGGSIRDGESIDYCDRHKIAMATTGIRHFKH
ncbi:MAG: bifunctional phosphoribosylaminoimidazolecarboxamide formyltransferase/IMP cyclohydrolase [Bacteroidales bacterium]|nr:bifunctional phosphoribosylaminoimidazolecarboxamide formyltransferase/IMP cyclohydrolase [Bacteroidales bacterium]MDD3200701.1 bifunctional phosphoribosylaminoimidazolecarboxamide formyltransferase/IMP cyclohydrolase [Bacteroidales bacterium]